MKILIVGFAKIKYMPYLNFYLEGLKADGVDLHVAYWNRDGVFEDTSNIQGVTFHEFKAKQKDEVSKVRKIFNFLKFKKFANKLIKSGGFDKIVVLHTLPAMLIYGALIKKYKDKFILDYRDYTYENHKGFRNRLHNLINASAFTFTSSDAYRKYFPKNAEDKIYTSHNLLVDSLSHRGEKTGKNTDGKIRIAFWGFIRHEEVNIKLIDKIAKDDRFELYYHGRVEKTAILLKAHAEKIGAKNVFFTGEYSPSDRYEFVKNTDILHNVYHDENTEMAVGNKYYDGLIFYIPQIVTENTMMGSLVLAANVGLTINVDDEDLTEKIYAYYNGLDYQVFKNACDTALLKVEKEYFAGQDAMQKFIKG